MISNSFLHADWFQPHLSIHPVDPPVEEQPSRLEDGDRIFVAAAFAGRPRSLPEGRDGGENPVHSVRMQCGFAAFHLV
jgi:hypothetical protein